MFICRLYWAARIYSSSYGIAWFSTEAFRKALLYMMVRDVITSEEMSSALREFRFGRSGREGSYFLRLLWHLDLAVMTRCERRLCYRLSSHGLRVAEKLRDSADPGILREVFDEWLPLLQFLEYTASRGRASVGEVVRDLGGEMRHWTRILAKLGVIRRGGIAKPYNNFVVKSLFVPLARYLGLMEIVDGQLRVTSEAAGLLRNLKTLKMRDVVRTMPGELTIYAGIADVLSDAREAYIVSPWVNHQLYEIIEHAKTLNPKLQAITLITRPHTRNREIISMVKNQRLVDINTHYYKRLHAKITLNPTGPAIESSANLLKTSLKLNFEVGTYYSRAPQRLLTAVEELQNIAT